MHCKVYVRFYAEGDLISGLKLSGEEERMEAHAAITLWIHCSMYGV